MEFLKEFRRRMGLFGTKEGREAKYTESKKDLFGFPLPEFGVSEYLDLPNLLEKRQEVLEKKEKEEEEAKQEELGKSVGDTKTLRTLATEALIRDVENRLQNRRDLNLISQTMPIVDTYAETAMQRALQADRFSPTKISQQRLRAQTGEAALMQAIANQASAAAQMGSLGTGRRYGR